MSSNSEKVSELVKGINSCANKIDLKIVSVVLFGSLAKQDTDKASDIDVIVVVDDLSSDAQISKLKKYLYSIEEDIGLRIKASGLANRLQVIFDRMGAQYKSMFVCREDEFVNSNAGKIFHTESFFDGVILDNPLLRNDIGFKNILLSAKVVYGRDVLTGLQNVSPIRKKQLAQNRITYSSLNLYSLLVCVFARNATKYSMSALKWTLHSCYFVLTKEPGSLSREIAYFEKHFPSNVLTELKDLRKSYRKNLGFILRAQLYIWRLFTKTLKDASYPVRFDK
ncbi:nucleotidyltransferase domain-containing protein [Candidatus Nomurabacteria bacterium]|nr:nucleotidyltransferase domain-containing protein [Candidatus Nomurabacteria bacterium]